MGGAVALVVSFVLSLEDPVRFVAPGQATLQVARPGAQVIWHEHRTVFEGRSYDAPPGLAGAQFLIVGPDGQAVRAQPLGNQTWTSGSAERQSLARFEARAAGPHTVAVEGKLAPSVIAVSSDFMGSLFGTIGGALLLALLGVGGAVGLIAYRAGRDAAASRSASAGP